MLITRKLIVAVVSYRIVSYRILSYRILSRRNATVCRVCTTISIVAKTSFTSVIWVLATIHRCMRTLGVGPSLSSSRHNRHRNRRRYGGGPDAHRRWCAWWRGARVMGGSASAEVVSRRVTGSLCRSAAAQRYQMPNAVVNTVKVLLNKI